MNKNPLKDGALTAHSMGLGTVTHRMVQERAREIARINGHLENEIRPEDFAQARRELTGEPEIDPNIALLEAAPESGRWDPNPGSLGHKILPTGNEDEDEEGRSDQERLVEEGLAAAEHDQMLRAARESGEEEEESGTT